MATSNKERHNNEINLKESEDNQNRLGAVIEASKDAIVVLDDSEQINFMNEAAMKLFGCSSEVMGKPFFLALGQQYSTEFQNNFREGLQRFFEDRSDNSQRILEVPFRKLNGEVMINELSISSFVEDNKTMRLIIGREITERKKTEEKFRETQQKYEAAFESSIDALMLLDEKVF